MTVEVLSGIGCFNCHASQLTAYFQVKDGKNTRYLCESCCKLKIVKVKKLWSIENSTTKLTDSEGKK